MSDAVILELVQQLVDAARAKGYAQGRTDALHDRPADPLPDSAIHAVLYTLIAERDSASVNVDIRCINPTLRYGILDKGLDPTTGIYRRYEIVHQ